MWFNHEQTSDFVFTKHSFLKLSSTQDIANLWVENQAFEKEGWTLITAREQYAGRGQKLNIWISPKGGLYSSLIFLWPSSAQNQIPWISCAGAVSLCQALSKFGIHAHVRGYNDVCIHHQKCAGFLTNSHFYDPNFFSMILGYGINFSSQIQKFQPDIHQSITSLSQWNPLWEEIGAKESQDLLALFEGCLFFWLKNLSQNKSDADFQKALLHFRADND